MEYKILLVFERLEVKTMTKKIYEDLIKNVHLEKGNVLFVSSDITKVAYHFLSNKLKFDPNILIDCLIEKIGENGTLIFPTYNWDFCKGVTFDYNKTKSKVGSLTNVALQRKDFKRTQHPIYSFAVWGKDKELLCSMQNKSSFGIDSPFAYFYKANAKNLFIDVDYKNSATFVHHIEEKTEVNYRFLKDFTAEYIDENNNLSTRTYSMYVRPLDKEVEVTINPMHELFLQNKIVEDTVNMGCLFRVLDMHKAYDLVEDDALNNESRRLIQY